MAYQCPKCMSTERIKSGWAHGMQRWKCKECGYYYTKSTPRGYPLEVKRLALRLYLEGLGFRAIERILKVSNVAVLKWVRKAAGELRAERPKYDATGKLMEIDEMWHYVGKKTAMSGCGWLLIEIPEISSVSGLVVVVEKH
jgi:transposase